jgi:hypothetical protein
MQAWAQALAMDPDTVTPFLIEYNGLQSTRLQEVSLALRRFTRRLKTAEQELLTLYFGKGLSSHQVAAQQGITPAAADAGLQALRQSLAEALEVSPALQLALQAESDPVRQAFIEDCLLWSYRGGTASPSGLTPEFQKCIQGHFGPTADLLCPRSWD